MPQSIEAEQGALGCILLESKCLAEAKQALKPGVFYDLRHEGIYNALLAMEPLPAGPVDIALLSQKLRDARQLEQIGGMAYLSTLPDVTPSAANLSYYLGILEEKWKCRRIVQKCTEVIERVYGCDGDIDELLWVTQSDLQSVFDQSKADTAVATVADIEKYDVGNDPNCLFGNRYVCRRGSLIIVGPAGVGKSSLIMQLTCGLAVGKPIFSIAGQRPLKILLVQAENDDGDLKEMLNGVREGLKLDFDEEEVLKKNLLIKRDATRTGMEFVANLRRLVAEYMPDVVVLDPAVSFVGDNMGDQRACSNFFRVGLNSVAEEFGCAFIIVNHTTKPPNDSKSRSGWQSSDWQYAGAGSYDIVGWARAVMVLRQVGPNAFNLKLAKRGKRAGAANPDGSPTTDLWLRHSEAGIFWEQVDPPEKSEEPSEQRGGKPSKIKEIADSNLYLFLTGCKPEGEGLNAIAKRLETWLASRSQDVSYNTCKRVIPLLVEKGKLTKTSESLYIRKQIDE